MCFGSQKVTQTTQVKLSPEQRELLNMGIGGVKEAQANEVPLPTPLPFDPSQTAAQEGVLAKTGEGGAVSNVAHGLSNAQQFLSGDVLDISRNPALQRTIDAATRTLEDSFLRTVLPGLRTEAVSAGALGNTRSDYTNVNAAQNFQRQVGDTAANITTDAYKAGLDALVKGTALAPTSMQALLFPEAAQEAVGTQRRDLASKVGSQAFDQNTLDFTRALQLLNAAGGIPGGGTTATASQPGGGIGSLVQSGLGAVSLLSAMLSDRRYKTQTMRVGSVKNGLSVWLFKYKMLPDWYIGLMADEVETVKPGAVISHQGIKYVDIEKALSV